MNKRVYMFIVALVLLFPTYEASCRWNDYYMAIAPQRFNTWLEDNDWRSPAAQVGNARLGVAFEYGLGFMGIGLVILAGGALLADLAWRRKTGQG